MENSQELQLSVKEPNSSSSAVYSPDHASVTSQTPFRKHTKYRWWLLVPFFSVLVLVGQSGGTLLGRFYFDTGGNSKWMATLVQSGGFPILIPLLIMFSSPPSSIPNPSNNAEAPSLAKLALIYVFFGVVACADNMMYSYGTLYLPVSIFSLICAIQLAFNALFSYFLNSLKFTSYIVNSLVLLTVSATVLGIQGDPSGTSDSNIPKGKYVVGFLCTVGASALFSLTLSLTQVFFEKVRKKETFSVVLELTFFSTMVATSASVVGLFASGEWREVKGEMELYKTGTVSYIMTLVWTAVLWQVYTISSLGLIFEASSLFSNVISTVCLPVVPILAVVLFHDKLDGMKIVAMFLAFWGFVSYVYQHYLEYAKSKLIRVSVNGISASS